jgi:hypothetical protein
MATLSRLVETVAQVEGMDPATVALFARTVREAGLIRTGGRGLSAAKMSFADATNLLIAVNASLSVRESARTVRRFRSLNAYYIPDGGDSVRLQHVSFGYALEELLKISAEEAWPKTFLTVTIPTGVFEAISESDFAITIAFHKPVPIVKLNIWGSIHGLWVGPEYMSFHFDKRIRELDDDPLPGGKLYRRIYPHDREETTEIGYRTIHAVSKLLRDGN